jgi:hypothetical protein
MNNIELAIAFSAHFPPSLLRSTPFPLCLEIGMAMLSRELLRLFAKGCLTGTQVQSLAHAAWQDGWGHDDALAMQLAKPGVDLNKSRNIARDVIRAAKEHGIMCTAADPYLVDLPDGKGQLNIFLPHEVYPSMLAKGGCPAWCLNQAELDVDSGLGPLLKQWAANEDVVFSGDLKNVGIMGLHCDGVAYTTSVRAGPSKTILVASWNIVSSRDTERRNQRQPLFVLRKGRLCGCGCSGYHTLQLLWGVVAWSLKCLLDGRSPSTRHDSSAWTEHDRVSRMPSGTPLPPAALLQVRGDWEWIIECFRLRHFNSNLFCWMCNATLAEGDMCFHDFRPEALHRGTLISHQSYLEACAREAVQPSALFRCPGVILDHLCVDSMHAGDLGTFQDAIGSLFWIEITHKKWSRNQRAGLLRLNADLKNFYTANKHLGLSSIYPMVLTQIKSEGHYPVLKSKAAQCRHLSEFALILAQKHRYGSRGRDPFEFTAAHHLAGHTDEHLEHLVAMFDGLARYHRSCATSPFDEQACRQALYQYLQALGGLHNLWRLGLGVEECKRMPFSLRQKSHVMQHLATDKLSLWGSPSRSWCYRDEDFVGAVKTIALKTSHPRTLEQRVVEKLMILEGLGVHV